MHGHALVPWTEVAEVRARPNRVVFVAPTGRDLPQFPRPARTNPRDAADARLAESYGRVLVIHSMYVNRSRPHAPRWPPARASPPPVGSAAA